MRKLAAEPSLRRQRLKMTVHVENHRSFDRESLRFEMNLARKTSFFRCLEIRLEPERKPRIYERASQLRTHMFEGFAVPSPFGFGARYKRVSNNSQHVSFNSTKNAFSQTVSESKPRKPAAQTGTNISLYQTSRISKEERW